MRQRSSLSAYPAATLQSVRAAVAALLKYQDILPTDLSIKLGLIIGDINDALSLAPGPVPTFVPHPATPPKPLPRQGDPVHQQVPRYPSTPRDSPPPERRTR